MLLEEKIEGGRWGIRRLTGGELELICGMVVSAKGAEILLGGWGFGV